MIREKYDYVRRALLWVPLDGKHANPDPGDPATVLPEPLDWVEPLADSAAMKAFKAALLGPGDQDMRAAVLAELAAYWKRDEADVLDRCVNWQDYSIAEWKAADRTTAAGLDDFYQRCESWAHALLWYDLLRVTGYGMPSAVAIAEWLDQHGIAAGSHLDFGAGTGTTSIMFHALGWRSTMGEASLPLLEFARARVARRGLAIEGIDTRAELPAQAYDVVTAIDTFAHVGDVPAAAAALHAALRPGGYLFANFDVRKQSDYNAWHIYAKADPLEWAIRRAGFAYVTTLSDRVTRVYQRAERPSRADFFRYGPPSRPYWSARRGGVSAARRVARWIWA